MYRSVKVFNRPLKLLQKRNAALSPNYPLVQYLRHESASRMADNLLDIKRNFDQCLDLGSGSGYLYQYIEEEKVNEITMVDSCHEMLYKDTEEEMQEKNLNQFTLKRQVCDEEELPFKKESFNAVLSSMSLHWVNDLPNVFSDVYKILKPDGLFMGAMLGGETLFELRTSLQLAELERKSGIAAHVSPFTRPQDVSGLLQQAGFNLTTITVDDTIIQYPTPFHLLSDLQEMGENNALLNIPPLSKDVLFAMDSIYKELYSGESSDMNNNEICVNATFQIIGFIGWKEGDEKVQPKPRGSATKSFKDL